jgi:hypothetical protein
MTFEVHLGQSRMGPDVRVPGDGQTGACWSCFQNESLGRVQRRCLLDWLQPLANMLSLTLFVVTAAQRARDRRSDAGGLGGVSAK